MRLFVRFSSHHRNFIFIISMAKVFFFGVVGPLGLLLGLGLLRRAADRSLLSRYGCVLFFKAFFLVLLLKESSSSKVVVVLLMK